MHICNPTNWSKTTWTVAGLAAVAILHRIAQMDFVWFWQQLLVAAASPKFETASYMLAIGTLGFCDKWITPERIRLNALERQARGGSTTPYYMLSAAILMLISVIYVVLAIQGLASVGSAGWMFFHEPSFMAAWKVLSMFIVTCGIIALQCIAAAYFFNWLPAWVAKVNKMEISEPEKVKMWISRCCGLGSLFAGVNAFLTLLF